MRMRRWDWDRSESGLLLPRRRGGLCNFMTGPSMLAHGGSGGGGTDAYSSAVLADTPLVYWRLGESLGTAALDSSGNARNGTYNGGFTLGQTGLVSGGNTAVQLNGTSGYVLTPITGLNLSRNFTLEAVIKPSVISGSQGIISAPNGGYYIRLSATGHIEFIKSFVASVGTGIATLSAGTRYHIALTVDAAGNWIIYVNGVLDNNGTTSQTFSSSTGVYLGRDVSAEWFNGVLDECAIYGSVLTSTRLAAHVAAM